MGAAYVRCTASNAMRNVEHNLTTVNTSTVGHLWELTWNEDSGSG